MRARLVLAAAIVLAIAGIAVTLTRDGGAREVTLRTAAETGMTPPAASALEVPTTVPQTVPTTTTIALPTTVSLPPLTVPLPKPPVTVTTPTVPTTSPPPPTRSRPAECGDPHGYGGWGGSRTQTTGKVTVTVRVYQCESYAGETVQNWVHVDHPNGLLRSARVDYGDGTVVEDTGTYAYSCQNQRPRPYYVNLSPHPYAAPGQYTVTATVVVGDCDDPAMQDQTATGSTTAFVYAGKRP